MLAGGVPAIGVAVDPGTIVSRTVGGPETLSGALVAGVVSGEGSGLSEVPGQSVEVGSGAFEATVGPESDVVRAVVGPEVFPVAPGAGVAAEEVPGANVGVAIGAPGVVTAAPAVVALEVVTDVDAETLVGAGKKRWPRWERPLPGEDVVGLEGRDWVYDYSRPLDEDTFERFARVGRTQPSGKWWVVC